jgi:hypothetical protein
MLGAGRWPLVRTWGPPTSTPKIARIWRSTSTESEEYQTWKHQEAELHGAALRAYRRAEPLAAVWDLARVGEVLSRQDFRGDRPRPFPSRAGVTDDGEQVRWVAGAHIASAAAASRLTEHESDEDGA